MSALLLALLNATASVGAEPTLPPLPTEVLRSASVRAFTPEDLARYDGRDPETPLLMAVRGIVFDVSEGARFYGPESRYHALVARDASRAVARMSIEPADLTDRCEGLDAKALERLATVMRNTYLQKYPVVGHVVGGSFFPSGLCCTADECGACPDD